MVNLRRNRDQGVDIIRHGTGNVLSECKRWDKHSHINSVIKRSLPEKYTV